MLTSLHAHSGVAILILIIWALISGAWIAVLSQRLARVSPQWRRLVKDMDGKGALQLLRDHLANAETLMRRMTEVKAAADESTRESREALAKATDATDRTARLEADVAEVVRRSATAVRKVGVARYNAVRDVGGDLSFSLVLMDDRDNGILVTSIYSLEDCRVYARGLTGARSDRPISAEEQRAIDLALAAGR